MVARTMPGSSPVATPTPSADRDALTGAPLEADSLRLTWHTWRVTPPLGSRAYAEAMPVPSQVSTSKIDPRTDWGTRAYHPAFLRYMTGRGSMSAEDVAFHRETNFWWHSRYACQRVYVAFCREFGERGGDRFGAAMAVICGEDLDVVAKAYHHSTFWVLRQQRLADRYAHRGYRSPTTAPATPQTPQPTD